MLIFKIFTEIQLYTILVRFLLFLFCFIFEFLSRLANTRVWGENGGVDLSALTGTHPTILTLIKDLEETRQQTNPIVTEDISNDR